MKRNTQIVLLIVALCVLLTIKLTWESCILLQPPIKKPFAGAQYCLPSSLRSVLADLAWIQVTSAWQERNWRRLETHAKRALWLRPAEPLFFELAGWHLAWNAALDVEQSKQVAASELSAYYIGVGRRIFADGIARYPNHWPLYQMLGLLEGERAHDWKAAADWYERGARVPNAPAFLGRLAARARERSGESFP